MLGEPFLRKKEVLIMTLRNVFFKHPDCSYLDVEASKIDPKLPRLTDHKYITDDKILYPVEHKSDRFHPKTLVYSIEYKSKDVNQKDYRHSVVVSKDASKDKINSFDYIDESGYAEYFDKWMEKIREKGGILMPVFWFGWWAAHAGVKEITVIKL